MDRPPASEAGDTGSIPVGSTIDKTVKSFNNTLFMAESFQQRVLDHLGLDIDELSKEVLKPDQHRIAEMFHGTTEQSSLSSASKVLKIVERATRGNRFLGVRAAATFAHAFYQEKGGEPADTDFLHDAHSGVQQMTRDILQGMMLPESGIVPGDSIDHFQQAMELNRQGESVMFEIVPHSSELDPVFIDTIMRELQNSRDASVARDAGEFLEKSLMIIGHKVMLSRLRRTFAGTVRALSTIAPKYRVNLKPETEAPLIGTHSAAVGKIAAAARKHAEYVLLLCPEGGRTKNGQIGMYRVSGMGGGYRVPLMLNMPDNYLGLDSTNPESLLPANVQLYVGKPHIPDTRRYVESTRESLQTVFAPVNRFQWGYKSPDRDAPNIDRVRGAPEIFEPISS